MLGDKQDRRWGSTLLVALTVVAFAGALPLLEGHLSRPATPIRRELELRPSRPSGASVAVVVTPAGWHFVDQTRESVTLRSGSSTLDLRMVPAVSDAECGQVGDSAVAELSATHQVTVSGADQPVATADGSTAVLAAFSSGLEDGVVFAVCAPGAALVGVATAPIGARLNDLVDVDELLRSVRFR